MIPPSAAALTRGSAAASSSTHGRSLSLPKLIIPRQTRDTRRPVEPRFTYFTMGLQIGGIQRAEYHLRPRAGPGPVVVRGRGRGSYQAPCDTGSTAGTGPGSSASRMLYRPYRP